MKIGVLLPRSVEHPAMAKDFYNGIKCHMQLLNLSKIELVHETIGFGGVATEVLEKIESLVVVHSVKIIIGFFDLKILDKIQPYVEANKILLILTNAGANYPIDFTNTSNYVVHLNAQQSFASWLAGKAATLQQNRNAAFVSTYYDCGYLHATAITNGVTDNGGALKYNYINPQHYVQSFELNELHTQVTSNDINNLLCIMDANAATLFIEAIKNYDSLLSKKYFVSSQFLAAKNIKTIDFIGYTFWQNSLDNEANIIMTTVLKSETESEPSIFSVLGWEAMQICQFLIQNEMDFAAHSFYNYKTNTPRGELIYDSATNTFVADMYLVQKESNSNQVKITKQTTSESDWERFSTYITEGAVSGWTNTYLCY